MSFVYNDTFNAKLQKIKDCIEFKNDHVVSTYMGQAVPPSFYDDITLQEYMEDPIRGADLYIDFLKRLNSEAPVDCSNLGYPAIHYTGMKMSWWSKVRRPGHELPADSVWQVEEKNRMLDSDYDTIANGGLAEVQSRILADILEPGEIEKVMEYNEKIAPIIMQKYIDAGFPVIGGAAASCPPFETLCGGRGMNKFFMDCYKKLDKVKAAQDAMMPGILAGVKATKKEPHIIGGWIGGWRGASNMVNPKIWDTLVWPYMKEVALCMIENDLTPIFHLDACWDRDIEHFLELPAKKCIINPDGMTDMRKLRKILGDHVALMGDVPSQMLTVASKEAVKDYTRRLVEDIGPKGLFLTAGCDAPTCSKYENLVAIHEVAAEF